MQLDLVDSVAQPDELALGEATTMVITFFVGFDGTTGLDDFFVGVKAFFTLRFRLLLRSCGWEALPAKSPSQSAPPRRETNHTLKREPLELEYGDSM
jgi:hypothetical protein